MWLPKSLKMILKAQLLPAEVIFLIRRSKEISIYLQLKRDFI